MEVTDMAFLSGLDKAMKWALMIGAFGAKPEVFRSGIELLMKKKMMEHDMELEERKMDLMEKTTAKELELKERALELDEAELEFNKQRLQMVMDAYRKAFSMIFNSSSKDLLPLISAEKQKLMKANEEMSLKSLENFNLNFEFNPFRRD